jgi:hypothetical protein
MKAWAIVGYTFNAETKCLHCIRRWAANLVESSGRNSEFVGVEDLLDILAPLEGISDREDEHTFDSDDFPKVIFASQVEDTETCDECGDELI